MFGLTLRYTTYACRYFLMRAHKLPLPVFNVKDIAARPWVYEESINLRKIKLYNNQSINDILTGCKDLKNAEHEQQKLAYERNLINKSQGSDTPDISTSRKVLKDQFKKISSSISEIKQNLQNILGTVPNLVSENLDEREFKVIKQNDVPLLDKENSFNHLETRLVDLATGSQVSGNGQTYLNGDLSMLEQVLIMYALRKCRQFNFELVSSPTMVRTDYVEACGFQPRDDASQIYFVKDTDTCLIGTAEIPLAAQMANQKINKLPLQHAGVSKAYRAEAGSRGKESKGIYRLHEFNKVEMFIWCEPTLEESTKWFNKLIEFQYNILSSVLNNSVPLRIIQIPPDDLGAPAYRKYDIEAWMPNRQSWGELSSCSICLDYQARRLHTKNSQNQFVHTLNATALAVPRVILSLIENSNGKINLSPELAELMGKSSIDL